MPNLAAPFHRWLCLSLLLWICAATVAAQLAQASERRVALVVGNASYADKPLRNPVNDAELMQRTLKELGFDVTLLRNADRRTLLGGLREFEAKARNADVALFFYAGHGAQVGGSNYLIPLQAQIRAESDVPDEAVDAASVLRRIEDAKARIGLVILDACRDNPYAGASRSSSRGLARMSVPTGSIVAYAAAPGETADDGKGNNGLYTEQLVRNLQTAGLDLREVFDRTATEVERLTNGKQRPREDVGLRGRIVLKPGSGTQIASVVPEPVRTAPVAQPSPQPAQPAQPVQATAPPPAPPTAQALRPGSVTKDCSDCPELVVIPAGRFIMGSNGGYADENPIHPVNIKQFAIGKTEVTQAQWQALMGSNPSEFTNCGPSCPVEKVSWDDVQQFIQKLNAKTGQSYRLPSESEWEYAARAGSQSKYSFGDSEGQLGQHAWYRENSARAWYNSERSTKPVAGKQANAFGLHDMHGNVSEWVEDCYHDTYSGAPTDGSAWTTNCKDNRREIGRAHV